MSEPYVAVGPVRLRRGVCPDACRPRALLTAARAPCRDADLGVDLDPASPRSFDAYVGTMHDALMATAAVAGEPAAQTDARCVGATAVSWSSLRGRRAGNDI